MPSSRAFVFMMWTNCCSPPAMLGDGDGGVAAERPSSIPEIAQVWRSPASSQPGRPGGGVRTDGDDVVRLAWPASVASTAMSTVMSLVRLAGERSEAPCSEDGA